MYLWRLWVFCLELEPEKDKAWEKVEEIMTKVKRQEITVREAAKMFDVWRQENPELLKQRGGLVDVNNFIA